MRRLTSVVPRIVFVLPSASDSVAEVWLRDKPQESTTSVETKLVLPRSPAARGHSAAVLALET